MRDDVESYLPLKYRLPRAGDPVGSSVILCAYTKSSPTLCTRVEKLKSKTKISRRDWASLLVDVLAFARTKHLEVLPRQGWHAAAAAFEEPCKAFRQFLATRDPARRFPDIPPAFVHVVADILADGVISATEQEYLEEKRIEYCVEEPRAKQVTLWIRENNPALDSLIREIAQDGVVTAIEERLLFERAQMLGVDDSYVPGFLRVYLALANLDPDTCSNTFRAMVSAVIYARHILPLDIMIQRDLDTVIRRCLVGEGGKDSDYSLVTSRAVDAFNQALTRRFGYQLDLSGRIEDTMSLILELELPNSGSAQSGEVLRSLRASTADQIRTSSERAHRDGDAKFVLRAIRELERRKSQRARRTVAILRQLLLDGGTTRMPTVGVGTAAAGGQIEPFKLGNWRYQIRHVAIRHLPLFSHVVEGDEVLITLNTSHTFLRDQTPDVTQLVRQMSLAFTITRLEHYADEEMLDAFFQHSSVKAQIVRRALAVNHSENSK